MESQIQEVRAIPSCPDLFFWGVADLLLASCFLLLLEEVHNPLNHVRLDSTSSDLSSCARGCLQSESRVVECSVQREWKRQLAVRKLGPGETCKHGGKRILRRIYFGHAFVIKRILANER